jgi:Na+-transporting NADH:ubiquinone oxidoreductase subunit NqrB
MSNSEIYKLAGLKLYADAENSQPNFFKLGLKADFKLYGLFIGEILYHKVISMINQREHTKFIAKKKLLVRNIFVLFFVFTGLSLGGNVLYNMLVRNINNYLLLVLSIIFSVLMPLFILLIKPELVISIDNENNQKE